MLAFVVNPGNGSILNRLRSILSRSNDLSPLVEPAKKILLDANRKRALAGLDFAGKPLAKLAPATIKDRLRKGYPAGPPLVRSGDNAMIIKGCMVTATIRAGQIRFAKAYVDPIVEHHVTGTPRMPKRDPLGFGDELVTVRRMLPRHVMGRGT